jgi:hypothetical protein
MAHASARRSFHGPLLVSPGRAEPRVRPAAPSPMPAPPRVSVHRTRAGDERLVEASTTNEREQLLHGVLAALRGLTSGSR